MERGYIGNRFWWTSLGFDGLNGNATFPKIDDAGARWRTRFQTFMKPWRGKIPTRCATIMGQVSGDASVQHVNFPESLLQWLDIVKAAGYVPIFRPHPLDRRPDRFNRLTTLGGTLDDALKKTAFVVTFNSNSGVDAVLSGVPTITCDRSAMAWDVTGHSIESIKWTVDRESWAHRMAYTQWAPAEIEAGDAWGALKTLL